MPKRRKKAQRRPAAAAARAATSAPPGGAKSTRARLLIENLLILAVLAYAYVLQRWDLDLYYRSVQEDEYLEWATFWAFVAAAVVAFVLAARRWRAAAKLPWFHAGVALFCLFVALEEISWGQRVFAYRPPVYFLVHNFQQELNLHNVVSTSWRKLGLMGVILGYGVALPLLLALFPPLRRRLARGGIVFPPLGLAPAFLLTHITYQRYPWKFSGEVVELMLGFGFLFALLEALLRYGSAAERQAAPSLSLLTVVPWAVVLALGLSTAWITRLVWQAQPELVAAARAETRALARDFEDRAPRNRCGIHKRVYSFVEKYEQAGLLDGDFAGLTAQGLPPERAEFFLDPWNSPYWIRYKCEKRPTVKRAFVYSFGPNRRRDSSKWEIRGDDVGTVFVSEGDLPGEAAAGDEDQE